MEKKESRTNRENQMTLSVPRGMTYQDYIIIVKKTDELYMIDVSTPSAFLKDLVTKLLIKNNKIGCKNRTYWND